jgi:hypothetical protein
MSSLRRGSVSRQPILHFLYHGRGWAQPLLAVDAMPSCSPLMLAAGRVEANPSLKSNANGFLRPFPPLQCVVRLPGPPWAILPECHCRFVAVQD